MKPWPEAKTLPLIRILLGLAALVLLIQTLHRALRPDGYDFTPRLLAAKALVEGVNPYQIATPFPLTYPLFICVLLIPLAWMPYLLANILWFGVNAASLWFSIRYLVKSYDSRTTESEFLKLFALGCLLFLNIIQNNFANGQVNLPVLALSVLFFKCLAEKKKHWGGFFLAAAISLKLTPLLFTVYLLFRREWTALAWTFFYTALFIFGLPYLIAGPSILTDYHGYLFDYVAGNFGAAPPRLSEVYFLSAYLHPLLPFLKGFYINLLACSMVAAPLIWLQLKADETPRAQTLLFCLYSVSILWMLPCSETHHLALLFPAGFLLARRALWETKSSRGPWILILAWLTALIWLGKLSFTAFFAAIGTCYLLLAWILRKEAAVRAKK